MNRESIDKETKHVSSVERHVEMLENMTPDEIARELRNSREQVTERWESCNRSFTMLFAALNGSTARPIDRFDVKTKHEETHGSTYEDYVRIWKDHREGTYKARLMVRVDGIIEDNEFNETDTFGDTYEYRFGTSYSHSAKIKMRDMIGGGVKMERRDGYLVEGVTQYETAVLLSAIEDMIMPSHDNNVDTLALLWSSIQNEEWNPAYAKAYKDYISSWNS